MKSCLLGLLFFLPYLWPADPVREAFSQAQAVGHMRAPEFRHRYLVQLGTGSGPASGFTAYTPGGAPAFTKEIQLPGGRNTSVADVDFDSDGNSAIAAGALGNSGYPQGIVLLDRSGQQTRFIDTDRFVVTRVTFAPDHTIWALGWQRDPHNPVMTDQQDYMIVRQFSFAGRELKAFLPRSAFPKGLSAGGRGQIFVTEDRIGVLVLSGRTSDNQEWMELDLHGNLLRRLRTDGIIRSPILAAFTADDHAYLQGEGHGDLYAVDPESNTWRLAQSQGATLLGADGNALVYRQPCCGLIRLQWFDQPAVRADSSRMGGADVE